jgi:PAS domain S-box-containing protein
MQNRTPENSKNLSYWHLAGFIALVFILFAGLAFVGLRESEKSEVRLTHTGEVRNEATLLLAKLVDAETGQRGYLLTSQTFYLNPYYAALPAVRNHFVELRRLTVNDEVQQRELNRLEPVISEKLAELADTVDLWQHEKHAAALAVVLTHHGQSLMDQARGLLDELIQREENTWKLESAQAAMIAHQLERCLILALLVSGTLLVVGFRSLKEERGLRLAAYRTLDQVEERHVIALNAADLGTWTHDLLEDEVLFSDRAKEMFGLPLDNEMNYKRFEAALHPEDLQRTSEAIQRTLNGQEGYNIEYRVLWPDGSIHWVRAKGSTQLNQVGKPVRFQGVLIDLDEQVRARLAVRASEERYTALFRNKVNAICHCRAVYDASGNAIDFCFLEVNEAYESITGLRKTDVENKTAKELFPGIENFELDFIGVYGKVAREGGETSLETYFAPLGKWLSIYVYSPASGEFVVIFTDVSARKKAELALFVNNEELAEQTRRAEHANLAKSNFLAAMSHEIRTPMNAILGMSDMLAESRLDAEQTQYVEVFQRAGANLLILINDILDLSKIEAGHMELEHVDFDLEDIVDQAVELTGVKTRAKGIGLMSHLSLGLTTTLVGDPGRLRQVLINLLGNAVKFTEAGEVLLTVQNHGSGNSGEIEFSVSDTGIGIAADKLESIFGNFNQADSSITRRYGGTGLGLEISRRLVEHMGGRLTVTSNLGQGSTFRFNARFERRSQSERKTPIEVTDFRGLRVLVIDDNATNRFILGETLNAWGIQSVDFATPAKALSSLSAAMVSRRPFALAMVDREMPEMDGFETAAKIKQIAPELPIVMFMSDVRPGDVLRRREAGLSGYAIKPVKRSDLYRLISEAMQPRECGDSPIQRDTDPEETLPVKSFRILIAEDSEDNRLLLKAYLKNSPHQFVFAENGKLAVEKFVAGTFDLILMDMQMPVMDGLTATRSIRAIERERGSGAIPILALTANALPQDVASTREAGGTYHISKPITRQTLLNAIEDFGPITPPVNTPGAGTP